MPKVLCVLTFASEGTVWKELPSLRCMHALNWHFMIYIVLPLEVIPLSLKQLG